MPSRARLVSFDQTKLHRLVRALNRRETACGQNHEKRAPRARRSSKQLEAWMDWTDKSIARLRALWDEGLSSAEIGRRLNCSKNAVVGKAHRLGLPGRDSPIRAAAGKPSAPKPAVNERRKALSSISGVRAVPVAPKPVRRSAPSDGGCRFIPGDPRGNRNPYCCAPCQPGSVYCPEHHAQCYQQPGRMDVPDEACTRTAYRAIMPHMLLDQ